MTQFFDTLTPADELVANQEAKRERAIFNRMSALSKRIMEAIAESVRRNGNKAVVCCNISDYPTKLQFEAEINALFVQLRVKGYGASWNAKSNGRHGVTAALTITWGTIESPVRPWEDNQ